MGAKAVSSLQYNEDNMKAGVHVRVSDVCGDANNVTPVTFTISHETEQVEEHVVDNVSETSTVRRRRSEKNEEKGESYKIAQISDELTDLNIGDGQNDMKQHPKVIYRSDPLKWFGMLVPKTLRDSQEHFQKAVDITVELAQEKCKLVVLQEQCKELRKQKNDILNSDVSDLFSGSFSMTSSIISNVSTMSSTSVDDC